MPLAPRKWSPGPGAGDFRAGEVWGREALEELAGGQTWMALECLGAPASAPPPHHVSPDLLSASSPTPWTTGRQGWMETDVSSADILHALSSPTGRWPLPGC